MRVNLGSVIKDEKGLHVVTGIVNGNAIAETVPLEEYISRNLVINYNGESRTIQEIIEMECDNYLSKAEVIEF